MREHIYEGRTHDGHWVRGYYFKEGVRPFIRTLSGDFCVEESTVGQFTGEFDKRGQRIFENHVVEIRRYVYTVIFDRGEFVAVRKNPSGGLIREKITDVDRIIGNKFERNPL